MSVPSDIQLDAGETVVADGIIEGLAPREIARGTFLAMVGVKNPVGKPRVHDHEALLARLLAGESPSVVFRDVGGGTRWAVMAKFRERGG